MSDKSYKNFISNHVNRIFIHSELQRRYIKRKVPELYEEEYLWCGLIKKMVSDSFFRNGLIFAGPDGSGRHSAAMLAVSYVAENYDAPCGFIYLSGNDMDFDENILEADAEYRKNMAYIEGGYPLNITELLIDELTNQVLADIMKQRQDNGCIILLLDDDEQGALWNKLCQSVAYYLLNYNDNPRLPKMFVFVVTKDASRVPHCLRRDLNIISMNYPSADERKKLIDNRIYHPSLNQMTLLQTEGMGLDAVKAMIEETWYYLCSQDEKEAKSKAEDKQTHTADIQVTEMTEEDKQTRTAAIQRLAESIKYKPAAVSNAAPVVIASGNGMDPSTMMTAFEKMGEAISQKITANAPHQLSLNEMPEDLKQTGDETLQKKTPTEIREAAKNSTWSDFLAEFGLHLGEDEEESEDT